jgi:hypothetical protein
MAEAKTTIPNSDSRDTTRTYKQLVSDLGRDALVIVGTGASIAATKSDLASWTGLLKNGAQECESHEDSLRGGFVQTLNHLIDSNDPDQLLRAASIIGRKLSKLAPGQYARWLADTVGSLKAKNPAIIEAIRNLSLPPATTNYDGLLSADKQLFPITWAEHSRLDSFYEKKGNTILHLHGYYGDPESVMLGLDDYERINSSDKAEHFL